MHIHITQSDQFYLDIKVDGVSFFKSTTIQTKSELLHSAIRKLENDIIQIANKSRHKSLGAFFWCYTYDIHRDDGIKGTVLDYYIVEILMFLKQKGEIEEIKVLSVLDFQTIRAIKDNVTDVCYTSNRYRTFFKSFIRQHFGPIKYLLNYFVSSLNFKGPKFKKNIDNSAFIFSNYQSNLNRLKDFHLDLNVDNVFILDHTLTKIVETNSKKQFSTFSYNTHTIYRALVKIHLFYKQRREVIKETNNNLFSTRLKKQTFFQTLYVLLRWEAYQEIFRKYKPKQLIVSSAFGDPFRRMPLGAAKQVDIKTVLFLCRPNLSYLRAEDRIIQPDIFTYNQTSIGDNIIVLDTSSYESLCDSGISPDCVKVYDFRNMSKPEAKNIFENGILILFAHNKYNDDIITTLEKFVKQGLSLKYVYFREHPSIKITNHQIKRLEEIASNVINITKYNWVDISFRNVITFTANSTSAIDANSCGAEVAWCPYYTEHSTQFYPIMKNFGHICNSEMEFYNFLLSRISQ